MSMTIEEISGILTRMSLPNKIDNAGDVMTGVPTERFTGPNGEKILLLHVALRDLELGQMCSIQTSPALFNTKGSEHRDALLKLCSLLQYYVEPVQFIYTPQANILARIEIPLADNKLTRDQLYMCLRIMSAVIDQAYDPLKQALETGVLDLPEEFKGLADAEGHPETTRL